jgi:N-acetylglutamate synthase-like GNAT family acetyltransferase
MYVIPGERDGGVGGRLVEAVLARAQDLGLERVTVLSSPRLLHARTCRSDPYP